MPVQSVNAYTAPPAVAQVPGADQVRATTLANGMQLIVWPDRDIPNVALYNWVRVGSRNEVPGITGLAHFFEHMMFNGTSKLAPGESRTLDFTFDVTSALKEEEAGEKGDEAKSDDMAHKHGIRGSRIRSGA